MMAKRHYLNRDNCRPICTKTYVIKSMKPKNQSSQSSHSSHSSQSDPDMKYIHIDYDIYDYEIDMESHKSYNENQLRYLLGTCGLNRLVHLMHKRDIYDIIPIVSEYDQRVLFDYLRRREALYKSITK